MPYTQLAHLDGNGHKDTQMGIDTQTLTWESTLRHSDGTFLCRRKHFFITFLWTYVSERFPTVPLSYMHLLVDPQVTIFHVAIISSSHHDVVDYSFGTEKKSLL